MIFILIFCIFSNFVMSNPSKTINKTKIVTVRVNNKITFVYMDPKDIKKFHIIGGHYE